LVYTSFTIWLNNIIIPAFEPKLNNRFIVNFPEELDIPSWCVSKITKPEYTYQWSPMTIVFRDPIAPSISQRIYNILESNIKGLPNQLKEFNITSVDPTGVEVENWLITVDEILYVNFGVLDYSDDNLQEVTLQIVNFYINLVLSFFLFIF
jgi:hypothetical protein